MPWGVAAATPVRPALKWQEGRVGWYSRMVPGKGWIPCEKDDPGASEDLNRLRVHAVWDADKQRFVLRS
jgi:hypothetical protein